MTELTAQIAEFLQDGMVVFLHQGIIFLLWQEVVPGYLACHVGKSHIAGALLADKNLWVRVFCAEALHAGQFVHAVVGLWAHDVVLNLHHLTLFCTHERSGVVAIAEIVAVLARHFLVPLAAAETLRVHSNQGLDAVAAMDVQSLSNGAKSVGGIDVATVFLVVFQAPMQILSIRAVRILPISFPNAWFVEHVDVGTLCADDFAEESLLSHVQGAHLVIVIAAVLQEHAMQAVLLAQVDEFPALLQVHGAWHFDGCMLAVFQGTFGNGEMMVPVGGNVYQVDVLPLAHVDVSCRSAVDVSRGQTHVTQVFLCISGTTFFIVTEGNNLHAGNVAVAIHRPGPAASQAGKAHPHGLYLWNGQAQSRLLSDRTGRTLHDDGSLVPMPFRVGAGTLSKDDCAEAKHRNAN